MVRYLYYFWICTGALSAAKFGTLPSDKAAIKIANESLGWVHFGMVIETEPEEVIEEPVIVISDTIRANILEYFSENRIQSVLLHKGDEIVVIDGAPHEAGNPVMIANDAGTLEHVVEGCSIHFKEVRGDRILLSVDVGGAKDSMAINVPEFFRK